MFGKKYDGDGDTRGAIEGLAREIAKHRRTSLRDQYIEAIKSENGQYVVGVGDVYPESFADMIGVMPCKQPGYLVVGTCSSFLVETGGVAIDIESCKEFVNILGAAIAKAEREAGIL